MTHQSINVLRYQPEWRTMSGSLRQRSGDLGRSRVCKSDVVQACLALWGCGGALDSYISQTAATHGGSWRGRSALREPTPHPQAGSQSNSFHRFLTQG